MENSENSGFAIFNSNSVLGRQNRFAQSSCLALLVFPKCIQLVRSNSGTPHGQKPFAAESHRLLSALTAEPRSASSVVWSAAGNRSAVIATTTMSQTTACENLLSLSAQHSKIRALHRRSYMKAAAIKKGHTDERAVGFQGLY